MPGSNWQNITPYGLGQPGTAAYGAGGDQLNAAFRYPLDATRSAGRVGSIPTAEYPDGYLGTITSRRESRLDKAMGIGSRLTQRSYQRGVHKGERIDPQDYRWRPDFNPATGIEYEARGLQWQPTGGTPTTLTVQGKWNPATPADLGRLVEKGMQPDPQVKGAVLDPIRAEQLKRFLPTWG